MTLLSDVPFTTVSVGHTQAATRACQRKARHRERRVAIGEDNHPDQQGLRQASHTLLTFASRRRYNLWPEWSRGLVSGRCRRQEEG
jgi:hypothetical protein